MTVKVMTVLNSNGRVHAENMEGWLYKRASPFRQTMARQGRTLTSGCLVVSGSASPSKAILSNRDDPAQKLDRVMVESYLAFDRH